jgi:hypothetical protein
MNINILAILFSRKVANPYPDTFKVESLRRVGFACQSSGQGQNQPSLARASLPRP